MFERMQAEGMGDGYLQGTRLCDAAFNMDTVSNILVHCICHDLLSSCVVFFAFHVGTGTKRAWPLIITLFPMTSC